MVVIKVTSYAASLISSLISASAVTKTIPVRLDKGDQNLCLLPQARLLVTATCAGNVLFHVYSPSLMITVLWQATSLQNILVLVLLKTFNVAENSQTSFCCK